MRRLFIVIIILLVLMLSGCAKVMYEKVMPDGTKVRIVYERAGNQSIGLAEGKADGSFKLEGQEAENTAMYNAINKLVDKIPSVPIVP